MKAKIINAREGWWYSHLENCAIEVSELAPGDKFNGIRTDPFKIEECFIVTSSDSPRKLILKQDVAIIEEAETQNSLEEVKPPLNGSSIEEEVPAALRHEFNESQLQCLLVLLKRELEDVKLFRDRLPLSVGISNIQAYINLIDHLRKKLLRDYERRSEGLNRNI